MTIDIGSQAFSTVTAAKDFFRKILWRYNIGDKLSIADEMFVMYLLDLHPHCVDKIGCGVESISIKRSTNTRCFLIHRVDGSTTDFSYLKCLRRPTAKKLVSDALRRAVRSQILDFRRRQFARGPVTCPITGDVLHEHSCHVDHYAPTFNEMVDRWIDSHGLTFENIKMRKSVDNEIGQSIESDALVRDWIEYHWRANLRIVSIRANLSILRKRR